MTDESLDDVDWRILAALQANGRASYADLAREVAMSASAVTERVRRLEEAGVIAGYSAVVDADRLGFGILAFVRLRYPSGHYKPFHDMLAGEPFTLDNVRAIRPANGLHTRHLEEILGRRAIRDIRRGTPLSFDLVDLSSGSKPVAPFA